MVFSGPSTNAARALAFAIICAFAIPAGAQSPAPVPAPITAPAPAVSAPDTTPSAGVQQPASSVPASPDVPKTHTQGSEPIKLLEGDAYPATLENIVKIALKYHKLDINNDEVLDDIAKVEYCGIYNRYHLDEFTWRKVRIALRQQINSESSRYPTLLYLNRREVFGQYNFSESMLMLKASSVLQGVNMLDMLPANRRTACGVPAETLTQDFVVVLDKQLNIDGVKMDENEAKAVISGLNNTARLQTSEIKAAKTASVSDANPENDVTRLGYGRYIVDLTGPSDPPLGMKEALVFSGHIESVTFFEDPYYQKPFWRGLASVRNYAESQSLASEIQFKGIKDDPATTTAPAVAPATPSH